MSMDLARKDFSTAPKYFIAGVDIGIAKATKTASEAVEAHAPVLIADGKVKPIAEPASAGTAVLTACTALLLTAQTQTRKCRSI